MIVIRKPFQSDFQIYSEIWSDPSTSHFIVDRNAPLNVDCAKAEFEKFLISKDITTYSFERINECIGYGQVIYNSDSYTISYAISLLHLNKGFGKKCVQLLLKQIPAFQTVFAFVHSENIFSQSILIQLGFQSLGIHDFEIGKRLKFVLQI